MESVAACCPSQLLGDTTGAADDHRDSSAGREIERPAIVVHRKPIGEQLHERLVVQNHGPRHSSERAARRRSEEANFSR
jgi:hypothetical protein